MTNFVEVGLGNALVALALAVVALVAGLVCRRPAVGHALWLLVLIKLVTPPLMSVPVAWPQEVPEAREEPPLVLEEMPLEVVGEPLVEGQVEPIPPEPVEPMEEFPIPEIPYAALSWQAGFGLAWLAGSLIWFAIAARRLVRFGRLLRHARPASKELVERVAALSRQLGLRKAPRVLLVQGHLSPMVWAAGRVTLLVPAKLVAQLTAPALDTLLAHELAHIRRRDHWVRWLELVGLGLYWWNPVVWLARRELRQAEELCCDAWVVRCLPDARRVYATALVDALDFLSRPDEPVPALGCGLGRVDDLKWRLTMILRGQTSPRLGWTTTLGVFALALMLLPLVPGFSPAQRIEPPKAEVDPTQNLDPDSRARLKAEIDALIQKRSAEAQAKKAHAQADYYRRLGYLKAAEEVGRRANEGNAQANEVEALKAEIAAKMVALKKLEAKLSERRESKSRGGHGLPRVETPVKPGEGMRFRFEFRLKGSPQEINATLDKLEKVLKEPNVKIDEVRVDPSFSRIAATPPTSAPPRKVGISPPFADKATTPASPDRRIEAVEKKLDAVLKELEALRKAKTPAGRGTRLIDPLRATPREADPGVRPPATRPGGAIAPLPAPAPRAAPGEATPLPGTKP